MRDVYVMGAYTTVFKKHPGRSFGDLAREAYMGALSDAGVKTGADIETGWMGSCGMGFWGQNSMRAQAWEFTRPMIGSMRGQSEASNVR